MPTVVSIVTRVWESHRRLPRRNSKPWQLPKTTHGKARAEILQETMWELGRSSTRLSHVRTKWSSTAHWTWMKQWSRIWLHKLRKCSWRHLTEKPKSNCPLSTERREIRSGQSLLMWEAASRQFRQWLTISMRHCLGPARRRRTQPASRQRTAPARCHRGLRVRASLGINLISLEASTTSLRTSSIEKNLGNPSSSTSDSSAKLQSSRAIWALYPAITLSSGTLRRTLLSICISNTQRQRFYQLLKRSSGIETKRSATLRLECQVKGSSYWIRRNQKTEPLVLLSIHKNPQLTGVNYLKKWLRHTFKITFKKYWATLSSKSLFRYSNKLTEEVANGTAMVGNET